MKYKLFYNMWIAVIVFSAVFGIIASASFTDKVINSGDERFDFQQNSYYIDYLYEEPENVDIMIDDLFEGAPLIAKVKYSGDSKYYQGQIGFNVKISEVYKGDSSLVGKEINYICDPFSIDIDSGFNWGSYVRQMDKGEEYLVFADPINNMLNCLPDNMYISSGTLYIPYYSFKEHNNKIVKLTNLEAEDYKEYLGFYNRDYPENEFYCSNEKALENVLEIKNI